MMEIVEKTRKSREKGGSYGMGIILITFTVLLIGTSFIRIKRPKSLCSYDTAYRRLVCKFKERTQIPDDLSETALALYIGDKNDKLENHFGLLVQENFTRYKHLQDIKLVKCGIEHVEPETFSNLDKLRKLDLSYNKLESLEPGTFQGLLYIEYLILSHNPLTQLGDGIFANAVIEHLIIENNPTLTAVSPNCFENATIRHLKFNRCNIAALDVKVFRPLKDHLEEFIFTNNLQQPGMPEKVFENIDDVKVDLSNNGIADTTFLKHLNASEIVLSDNHLKHFKLQNVAMSFGTQRLSLANTQLQDTLDFHGYESLLYLDLSNNEIDRFNLTTFTTLVHLESLDLSSNNIKHINVNTGNGTLLPALKSLYLHDNKLETLVQELEEALFYGLHNVTLRGNPLHCNCELSWLADWVETSHGKEKFPDLNSITCETPNYKNFTQMYDEEFMCRKPTIVNATLDTDGIHLVCSAEGDPPPSLTWINPGNEERTSLASASDRSTFERLHRVSIVQSGNYTCVAYNIEGNDSVTIDTTTLPNVGRRYQAKSQKIDIIETPAGFFMTCVLLVILGYLLRTT